MTFQAAQLPSGRWGIFNGERLLATIGSQQELNLLFTQLPSPTKFTEDQQAT